MHTAPRAVRISPVPFPVAIAFVLAVTACPLCAQQRAAAPPPNIVLVVTDDQGLGDFGVNGNPVLDTPHLDAFARQCPDVERFYVSPVCSPTRASLLTGRYNYRTRVVDTWIGRSMMDPGETTLAEILRGAGYRTGIFGKWHLGDCHPLRPIDQGFDEALVHRGGGLAQPSEPVENARRYTDPLLLRDGEPVATKGYCTDVYFDAAIAFVDACTAARRPFFAYVATNAPHAPFHDVPDEPYRKYRARDLTPVRRGERGDDDVIARTYAMIENIDANFGRLLAHLDERGVAANTIVVFLCDNGPEGGRYVRGLRGSKASVYEGGVRSPLWVRWPGHLSPSTVVTHVAAHIDVLPTLCDAAGVPLPAHVRVDGRSLLPLLEGRAVDWPERHVVLQTHRADVPAAEHHFAVVGERWKLVRASGFGRAAAPDDFPFELYDLAADPGEQHDLAGKEPDVVAALRRVYARWFADVSTTRPDNWAPPRIRPGTDKEPVTTLTRQDWRPADGEGWGHDGAWLLAFDAAQQLDVTLVFREPTRIDRVTVWSGGAPRVLPIAQEAARVPLGAIAFAAGDVDLRVVCERGDEKLAPYQIVLSRR